MNNIACRARPGVGSTSVQNYLETNLGATDVCNRHKHVFLTDHIVRVSLAHVLGSPGAKRRGQDTMRWQAVAHRGTARYIVETRLVCAGTEK